MKKSLNLLGIIVVLAIVVSMATFAISKTTGWGYFDALVIGTNPASPTASLTSAGALTVTSITGPSAVSATAMSTTGNMTVGGQLLLPSVSSTTIATLVPAAVGAVVYNNTRATICIGTAAVAGAWVFASTNGVTTAGVTCKE